MFWDRGLYTETLSPTAVLSPPVMITPERSSLGGTVMGLEVEGTISPNTGQQRALLWTLQISVLASVMKVSS